MSAIAVKHTPTMAADTEKTVLWCVNARSPAEASSGTGFSMRAHAKRQRELRSGPTRELDGAVKLPHQHRRAHRNRSRRAPDRPIHPIDRAPDRDHVHEVGHPAAHDEQPE